MSHDCHLMRYIVDYLDMQCKLTNVVVSERTKHYTLNTSGTVQAYYVLKAKSTTVLWPTCTAHSKKMCLTLELQY